MRKRSNKAEGKGEARKRIGSVGHTLKSVRQKETRTRAAKAEGERETVQTKRKPDGQKRKAENEAWKLKAEGKGESS